METQNTVKTLQEDGKKEEFSQSESLSRSVSKRFIYKEYYIGIVINAVTNPKLAEWMMMV